VQQVHHDHTKNATNILNSADSFYLAETRPEVLGPGLERDGDLLNSSISSVLPSECASCSCCVPLFDHRALISFSTRDFVLNEVHKYIEVPLCFWLNPYNNLESFGDPHPTF